MAEERPTDEEGAPPVTSPDYRTSREVVLEISAPAGTREVVISNAVDFEGAKTFDVADDGKYEWTLGEEPNNDGKHAVYVRFVGDGVDARITVSDAVQVDDKVPSLRGRYLDEKRIRGRRVRVWISLTAKDNATGGKYVQLARTKAKPWPWFRHVQIVSVRTGSTFLWGRIADGAGNVSGWTKIAFPKKPVLHRDRD